MTDQSGETGQADEWWRAVKAVASLIGRDGIEVDQEGLIRHELMEKGFAEAAVDKAIAFIDRASLSGSLMECLGMIYQGEDEYSSVRVEHPVERASLPETLWRSIDGCRRKGILDPDAAERLLEGVRTMDTRDWDAEDVDSFLSDVLEVSVPGLLSRAQGRHPSSARLSRILSGKSRHFYS